MKKKSLNHHQYNLNNNYYLNLHHNKKSKKNQSKLQSQGNISITKNSKDSTEIDYLNWNIRFHFYRLGISCKLMNFLEMRKITEEYDEFIKMENLEEKYKEYLKKKE